MVPDNKSKINAVSKKRAATIHVCEDGISTLETGTFISNWTASCKDAIPICYGVKLLTNTLVENKAVEYVNYLSENPTPLGNPRR